MWSNTGKQWRWKMKRYVLLVVAELAATITQAQQELESHEVADSGS